MAAGDRNVLAFANRNSLQHKQTRAYGAGAVCLNDGLFYEANNDISTGTAFAEGDSGQTWKLVGSKPIGDWEVSKEYKVKDQVFAETALWECKTSHTSGTSFEDTNWTLKAGLLNKSDFTLETETIDTVNFKAIKPKTAHEYLLGTSSLPFKAAYFEGIDFYAGTTYVGNIDGDSDHLGIYSGTASNTSTKLQLGTKNNTADISIEDTKIEVNKLVDFNNKDIRGANRLVFNDNGKNEGVCFANSALAEESDTRLAIYLESLPDFDNGVGYGSSYFNFEKTYFAPDSSQNGDINLGTNSRRWKTVYAVNSTISTSDEREKSFVDIPDKLLEVWFEYVKPKMYKWNKDVEKEGESFAGIHTGVSAQDVIKAFLAADLDWTKYEIVSIDLESSDTNEITFDYKDIDNLPPLSVRYDHVEIIEMAAIRHKLGL